MNHFQGITPEERWKNDVLDELRLIRGYLERDAQTVQVSNGQSVEKKRRPYRRRKDVES